MFTIPAYLATPLRKEYMDLYAKQLHQLLFCLLEWLMNTTALQEVIFARPDGSAVDKRVHAQVFTFLDACISCLDISHAYVREMHAKAWIPTPSSPSQGGNPATTFATQAQRVTPKSEIPPLPSAYVAACNVISDAASIVLRHLLNRVHHFPVACSSLSTSSSSSGRSSPPVSGLITTTVSEENDPVGDPQEEWMVGTQMRVDNGRVKVEILPYIRDAPPAASAVVADDPPRLHFVYGENVLITAYERAHFDDAAHTFSSTSVRIIIRDLTGKYVYDLDMLDGSSSDATNFHMLLSHLRNIGERDPSSSSLATVVHPALLAQAHETSRELAFAEMEKEWRENEEAEAGETAVDNASPAAVTVAQTPPGAPTIAETTDDDLADWDAPQLSRRRSGQDAHVVDVHRLSETVHRRASHATIRPEESRIASVNEGGGVEGGLDGPHMQYEDTDQFLDQIAEDAEDAGVGLEGASPLAFSGMMSPMAEPLAISDLPLASPLADSNSSVDKVAHLDVRCDLDPLEQVLSFLHAHYPKAELLAEEAEKAKLKRERERVKLQQKQSDMRLSYTRSNAAVSTSNASVTGVNHRGSVIPHAPSHVSPLSIPTAFDHGEELEGSGFIDMSSVKMDEEAFGGGYATTSATSNNHGNQPAVPPVLKKQGTLTKANKLLGIAEHAELSTADTTSSAQHLSSILTPTLPEPSSPSATRDSVSTFDSVRALLLRIYVGLDRLPSSLRSHPAHSSSTSAPVLIFLPSTTALRRSLKLLDTNPARECHKIGVLFVGKAQDSQKAVLANERGSEMYERFVEELGTLVHLSDHVGFMGGLDARSTGSTSRYWCSSTTELMWHIATLMPSKPLDQDAQQIHKKKQVGNDHVHVVWSEYERDYRPSTLPSQFNDVHIVIYPMNAPQIASMSVDAAALHYGLYRISIHCKASVPSFGPLLDGMAVRGVHLASLVRLTALNANRAIRYATPGYGRPEPTRRKYIEEMIQKQYALAAPLMKNPVDMFRALLPPMLLADATGAAIPTQLGVPAQFPPAPRLVNVETNPGPISHTASVVALLSHTDSLLFLLAMLQAPAKASITRNPKANPTRSSTRSSPRSAHPLVAPRNPRR